MSHSSLSQLLAAAAAGSFPPADGACHVLPPDESGVWAIVAFTGRAYVLGDVDAAELAEQMPDGDSGGFGGAHDPAVAMWIASRSPGLTCGVLDLVLVADLDHRRNMTGRRNATDGGERAAMLGEISGDDERWAHPRVRRALEHRRGVRVLGDPSGVAILGAGLAGRLEVSVERTDDDRHGRGRGRLLIETALDHAAATTSERWCWAQVAPGNARSLRSFLAAGFVPVCSEQLLIPSHTAR